MNFTDLLCISVVSNHTCNPCTLLSGYKSHNIDIKVLKYYIIFTHFILESNDIYVSQRYDPSTFSIKFLKRTSTL